MAPTSEAALATAQDSLRRNRRANWLMVAIVLVGMTVIVATFIIATLKFDQKFSAVQATSTNTNATVHAIYDNQQAGVARSTAILQCQVTGYDDILTAAGLALGGDRNRADYPVAPKCVLPPLPKPVSAPRVGHS